MQDEDVFICCINGIYKKSMDLAAIKRHNICKDFKFVEIAVDNHNLIYKPIDNRQPNKVINGEQIKMEI